MKTARFGIAFIILLLVSSLTIAKINFQAGGKDKIDLDKLVIDKEAFFDHVKNTILSHPPGLGNYGRVAFHPCDMEIEGLKLIDYKTMEDREIRYLSNPSCYQIVLRKVLEHDYRYNEKAISRYQNRQCMLSVEQIISPMLEYYTIKYEERKISDCPSCDFKEKERLDLILSTQKKISEHCTSDSTKVMNFITDLDAIIEKSYQTKTR